MVVRKTVEAGKGVDLGGGRGLIESLGLDTVAVFVMFEPPAALELTCTTTVNVAEPPAARVASVPLMVPVPPTGGLLKLKVGPLVCVSDTNVVLAGMVSVSCTFWASEGPLLLTVMV